MKYECLKFFPLPLVSKTMGQWSSTLQRWSAVSFLIHCFKHSWSIWIHSSILPSLMSQWFRLWATVMTPSRDDLISTWLVHSQHPMLRRALLYFPVAALTNYYKRGVLQIDAYFLRGGQKSKIKILAELHSVQRLYRRILFAFSSF